MELASVSGCDFVADGLPACFQKYQQKKRACNPSRLHTRLVFFVFYDFFKL
jgi:hypothetical protein